MDKIREALEEIALQCEDPYGTPDEDRKLFRSVALRARAALAALPSCEGWRQFDTAPEDGTEIIVWRADSGVFTSFYREADWWIATPTRPPEEDAAWFATTGEDLSDDLPTHWMPLPSPPER